MIVVAAIVHELAARLDVLTDTKRELRDLSMVSFKNQRQVVIYTEASPIFNSRSFLLDRKMITETSPSYPQGMTHKYDK